MSIPISLSDLVGVQTVELVVHYPSYLTYLGSFDPFGTSVDISGEAWPGRSKLRLTGVSSGTLAASAFFSALFDSANTPIVTFDSINVVSAATPCDYADTAIASSTIITPNACGRTILSQYLRENFPQIEVHPIPTTGTIFLTARENLGSVTVEVYDALATLCESSTVTLLSDKEAAIRLPHTDGVYWLRIRSANAILNKEVVLQHH